MFYLVVEVYKFSDGLTPEQDETVQAIVAMGYARDKVSSFENAWIFPSCSYHISH